MNGLDLSGKIIFKVKFDNEIKKIIIHNDEINHNELLLMIQRIFSEKIKPNDELIIKYTDEENDLITIANDSDVTLALQTSKIVKLTVYLDDKENNPKEEEIKASQVITELQHIRSSIDKFLDKFEKYLRIDKNKPNLEEIIKNTNDVKLSGSSTALINNDLHKEFDPLAKKIESNTLEVPNVSTSSSAAQKFLPIQKNSRAETPDSICSSEFSPNPKTKFSGQSNELNVASQSVPGSYGQEIHQQQQFNQPVQALNQPQNFQQQQQQQQPQISAQNQYAASQGLKFPSQTSMINQTQQYMQPQQPQYAVGVQQQNTQPIAHPSQIANQPMDPQLHNQFQAQQAQQAPQPSQYYQQPNPQQPGVMQPGQQMMPNQAQQTPPMPGAYSGYNLSTPNPYSQKNPQNMALGRPPSATAHYQQGYK